VDTVTDRFTRADYLKLPEGFPAELIEGRLVKRTTPLYGHQFLVGSLLLRFCELVGLRRVATWPVDVPIEEHTICQPDLAAYRDDLPPDESGTRVPFIAVEVVEPNTRARDRGIKTRKYLEAGVEEVWIVDAERGVIEVRDRDGVRAARGEERLVSVALEGLTLVPAELFDATG
jgi:Uma2 family endonuclease